MVQAWGSGRIGNARRYLLIVAYLALDVALHGSSPTQASGEGALQEVARQPAAPLTLCVLVIGLAAYGGWRLVQAVTGKPSPAEPASVLKRIGWFAIAAIYFGLCLRAVELIAGSGASETASSRSSTRSGEGAQIGPEAQRSSAP